MNYDTRNDVETNDACLAYLHQNLGLDYFDFFNRLRIMWNRLIKDTDYLPVKRIIEHVLLNMVDDMHYELYCQEADSKNWYRQELYKEKEESKNKETDEMASSNEEMIKSMARIHELIGDIDKEKEEPNTSVEEETDIEAYYNYTVEEEPEPEPKKSLFNSILYHVIFWVFALLLFILSIIFDRILLCLGLVIAFIIYMLLPLFLIYKDK